ncbi:MAG TPA: carboxypeptidase regulatory-like domain-containing protein, partial [Bacteroidia bacterium]|nr:carboxypeptidase regulatory-like domain-containing protein [Bacteroidia bacterium]
QLLNTNGDIMASTITDKEGSFKFENIPNNQEYLIKIHEQDSILKIHKQFYIANKDGRVVSSSVNDENFFLFKNINADLTRMDAQLPASDAALSYANMSGKLLSTDGKKPISNVNIALKDPEGKTISNITTDSTGSFSFDKLPSDNKYSIAVDNKSSSFPKHTKGFLLTNKDKEPLKYSSEMSDYFVFENLPADLNTLSILNTQDNSELPSMSGKLLKNINPEEGLANAGVSLLDHKGNLVETTQTDNRGYFKFEKLSSKKNYSIQLNEKDTAVKSASTIFLANNADKIVKAINTSEGDLTFKKVPADLMKMTEIKQSLLTQLSKNNSSLQYTLTSPDDYKYDFVMYFPYNKKEIDIASSSFRNFKEKIEQIIDENGKVTIIIASSSSTVPTRKFASNDELAHQRANEVKEKITSYLSSKNFNDSKINYEISTKVQGPAYNGDAQKNKQEYEKWQFVKVIVKS